MAEAPGSVDIKVRVEMPEGLRNDIELGRIFNDVRTEIVRARRKHGTQHETPMGTGPTLSILAELDDLAEVESMSELRYMNNAELERVVKLWCQETGDAWSKILLEEVIEALAALDDDLDAELVQVIAMGVSMLQAHRRQKAAK